MPGTLERLFSRSQDIETTGLTARANRAVVHVQDRTAIRVANVQGESMVQTSKLHEVDRLVREAMTGQAMLNQWNVVLSHGDPFLADDLRFFSDIARLGKGEIIADTVSTYCDESKRSNL